MLIPRFTLRTGLVGLTLCALVSIVVREAFLGHAWAIGVIGALATLALMFVVHALLFGAAWLISRRANLTQRGEK